MTYPHRAIPMGLTKNNTVPRKWATRPVSRPLRDLPKTLRYEVSHLDHNSQIMDFNRTAPAFPIFEDAFSAIARGTIITTADGPVAVEDLLPGTLVCTRDNGPQTLLWIGSMAIDPNAKNQSKGMDKLSRITADSFGLGRPMPDLLLGPRARLLRHDAALVTSLKAKAALAPITAFIDGNTVLEITPITPVRVYHLAFLRHQIICANGLEIESYHPGHSDKLRLSGEMRSLFLAMFPHIRTMNEFGPLAYPRMSHDDATGMLTT